MLAAWIGAQSKKEGAIHPAADNNWRLAPIHSNTPLDIRFETRLATKPRRLSKKAQYPMRQVATDDIGRHLSAGFEQCLFPAALRLPGLQG